MILIVAIAVGALAAFALLRYVRGVEDSAYEDTQLVEVWVLNQDVAKSTAAEVAQDALEIREIPMEFRPANAVSPDQIAGRVAAADLASNQILVSGMFVDPSVASVSFADLLDSRLVAVSVQFDQVRAVGGFLVPGDRVDMLVLSDSPEIGDTAVGDLATTPDDVIEAAAANTAYDQPARFLYQDVLIGAIGSQLPSQAGDAPVDTISASSSGTIVFFVPAEAAQRILSVSPDRLRLVLRADDAAISAIDPIGAEELVGALPGEDGTVLTPYGPSGYDAFVGEAADGAGESTVEAPTEEAPTEEAPAEEVGSAGAGG